MNIDERILHDLNTLIESRNEESVTLVCSVKTVDAWNCWLAKFSNATNTSWNTRKSFPNVKQCLFKKNYVCHLNQYRQSNSIARRLNTKCPARLSVKIHFYMGKSRNVRSVNPCVVTISGSHNHDTDTASSLANLKLSRDVKTIFRRYFEQGLSPCQAMQLHRTKLRESEEHFALSNSSLNPKHTFVYDLWKQWRLDRNGINDKKRLHASKQSRTKNSIASGNLSLHPKVDDNSESMLRENYDTNIASDSCTCFSQVVKSTSCKCNHEKSTSVHNDVSRNHICFLEVKEEGINDMMMEDNEMSNLALFAGPSISAPLSVETSIRLTQKEVNPTQQLELELEDYSSLNSGLLLNVSALLQAHVFKSIKSKEMSAALDAFAQTLEKIETTEMFTSALHNFGKNMFSSIMVEEKLPS